MAEYIVCDMSRMTLVGMSFIFYNFINDFTGTEYVEDFLFVFYAYSSYGFYSFLENKTGNNSEQSSDESTLDVELPKNYKH